MKRFFNDRIKALTPSLQYNWFRNSALIRSQNIPERDD